MSPDGCTCDTGNQAIKQSSNQSIKQTSFKNEKQRPDSSNVTSSTRFQPWQAGGTRPRADKVEHQTRWNIGQEPRNAGHGTGHAQRVQLRGWPAQCHVRGAKCCTGPSRQSETRSPSTGPTYLTRTHAHTHTRTHAHTHTRRQHDETRTHAGSTHMHNTARCVRSKP